MELNETIKLRRSIRNFNEKKVPKEIIEEILQAGILAPSAHNRQPWNFYVIENKEKREEIASILLAKTDLSTQRTCDVIKSCSALILVFADITNELMDVQSVGACIENMVLQATDLGIGSLWIGYITNIEKELQKIFNTNQKLIAGIALGYTDAYPSPRPRKTLEEVTHWYE